MNWEVREGDCMERLREMDAGSVDCCVTSPPYWGLRDYGVPGQLGLEATPEEFVAKLVAVFREVRRVLADHGTCWVNLGDSYHHDNPSGPQGKGGQRASRTFTAAGAGGKQSGLKPKDLVGIPWRVAFALQADGWYLRSDIVWAKPNPMPESVTDRPTRAHEYVFLLTKAARYFYDADAIKEPTSGTDERVGDGASYSWHQRVGATHMGTPPAGRNRRDVWTVATQPYSGAHFATFPEKLVEPMILAGCPAEVCAECGKPWVRVVERGNSEHHCRPGCGCKERKEGEAHDPGRDQNWEDGWRGYGGYSNTAVATNDFTPTCGCAAPTRPGTVLDPFCGSGTTGAVATEHNRRFIGIELNPEYAKLARERIGGAVPRLPLDAA